VRSVRRVGVAGALVLAALLFGARGAVAACASDMDCPGTACGGQVCDWTTGTPACVPAGSKWPQGVDGECATTADCKCAAEGAVCFSPFCSFTLPPDGGAAGAAGTTGGTGGGGPAGGSGASGGAHGGGCAVAPGTPAGPTTEVWLSLVALAAFGARKRRGWVPGGR